jgi:hypothetical protein
MTASLIAGDSPTHHTTPLSSATLIWAVLSSISGLCSELPKGS